LVLSLSTYFFALPNTIILDPARVAVCPYLAAGGVPEIFGF
jgi:hypothetical protein